MRGTAGFSLRRLCGAYQNEIKKKAFVLIRARVLLWFWEHVGGCHPHGEHRLEEALGALMLFWVPQPSVLLGRGYRHSMERVHQEAQQIISAYMLVPGFQQQQNIG